MAFGSHHLAQTCTGLLQNEESNGKEDGQEVGGSLFHGGTLPMRLIKGLIPTHKTPQPQNLHTPNRKLCCVFPISKELAAAQRTQHVGLFKSRCLHRRPIANQVLAFVLATGVVVQGVFGCRVWSPSDLSSNGWDERSIGLDFEFSTLIFRLDLFGVRTSDLTLGTFL